MVSERAHQDCHSMSGSTVTATLAGFLINHKVCVFSWTKRERKILSDFHSRNHTQTYQQQCLGRNSCSRVGADHACVSSWQSDGERARRRRTTCKAFLYHISCNNWLVGGQLSLTAHLLPYPHKHTFTRPIIREKENSGGSWEQMSLV